jgi:hypothetical protein
LAGTECFANPLPAGSGRTEFFVSFEPRQAAADRRTYAICVTNSATKASKNQTEYIGIPEMRSEIRKSGLYHEGAGALEHGVEFKLFSLSELARRGHSIEWSGQETLQAKDYDVLKVTMKDGFETYRFVNRETGLVDLSRDFRAFHPGIDATRQHLHTSRNFAPDKQQETNR